MKSHWEDKDKKYKIITYQSLCYIYFEHLEVRRGTVTARVGVGVGGCREYFPGRENLSLAIMFCLFESYSSTPPSPVGSLVCTQQPKIPRESSCWVSMFQAPLITLVQILQGADTDSCRSNPCKLQRTLVSQVKKIRSYHKKLNSCSTFLFSTWV